MSNKKRRARSSHAVRNKKAHAVAAVEPEATGEHLNQHDLDHAAEDDNPDASPIEGGDAGETQMSLLLRLKVKNLEEEKQAFFKSECSHAPQFIYEGCIKKETNRILQNHNVNFTLLLEAKQIMKIAKEKHGDLASFREHCYGTESCSTEELQKQVASYLRKHQIEDLVDTSIVDSMLSVANVTQPVPNGKYVLNVCAGSVMQGMIQGVCDHEIGTHLLRMINDEKQEWHKKRNKYRLANFCAMQHTEEGLATLNTCLSLPCKLLHEYALRYYAVCFGAKLGFVELFHELRSHSVDQESCWQLCCRIKRGLLDTSMPGAFWRDQTYLQGAVQILQHLESFRFDDDRMNLVMKHLYSGRIAVSDLRAVRYVVRDYDKIIKMPHFMRTAKALKSWKRHCLQVIEENCLHDVCSGPCIEPRSKSAPPKARPEGNVHAPQEIKNSVADSVSPVEVPDKLAVEGGEDPLLEKMPIQMSSPDVNSVPVRMSIHPAPEDAPLAPECNVQNSGDALVPHLRPFDAGWSYQCGNGKWQTGDAVPDTLSPIAKLDIGATCIPVPELQQVKCEDSRGDDVPGDTYSATAEKGVSVAKKRPKRRSRASSRRIQQGNMFSCESPKVVPAVGSAGGGDGKEPLKDTACAEVEAAEVQDLWEFLGSTSDGPGIAKGEDIDSERKVGGIVVGSKLNALPRGQIVINMTDSKEHRAHVKRGRSSCKCRIL